MIWPKKSHTYYIHSITVKKYTKLAFLYFKICFQLTMKTLNNNQTLKDQKQQGFRKVPGFWRKCQKLQWDVLCVCYEVEGCRNILKGLTITIMIFSGVFFNSCWSMCNGLEWCCLLNEFSTLYCSFLLVRNCSVVVQTVSVVVQIDRHKVTQVRFAKASLAKYGYKFHCSQHCSTISCFWNHSPNEHSKIASQRSVFRITVLDL